LCDAIPPAYRRPAMPTVRAETPDDPAAIRRVHALAFGGPEESRLVDALRTAGAARCALVAEVDGDVVGHVCFSPVVVGDDPTFPALGLGPVAVLPAHQRRGIGARLVREGLAAARGAGARAVVVLGEPDYYRRFGFTPARDHGLRCEYPGAEDAFMAIALVPDAFAGRAGLVRYRPEFAGV
jgi:putative acetyltransferase